MKLIHKRTKFTSDHKYIKDVLKYANTLYTEGKHQELAHLYNELSAVAAGLSAMASDNHHDVEDSACKGHPI